jgi:hypothetical protein
MEDSQVCCSLPSDKSHIFEKEKRTSLNLHALETKQLKSLVRNIIDPSRDLGHVDRALAKGRTGSGDDSRQSGQKVVAELQEGSQIPTTTALPASTEPGVKPAECEDCK